MYGRNVGEDRAAGNGAGQGVIPREERPARFRPPYFRKRWKNAAVGTCEASEARIALSMYSVSI